MFNFNFYLENLLNCRVWKNLNSTYFVKKTGPFMQYSSLFRLGTIHLRRQHVLEGEGCPHVPMVKKSQYIRIKNPLHKHFAGMPMVGG